MRYRLLGIAAIAGMAAGIFIGVYSCIDSLYHTRDFFYTKLSMADLEVRFVPTDAANVPDISHLDGVSEWATRLVSPGQLTLEGGSRHAATVITRNLGKPGSIARLQVLRGDTLHPERPNSVLVDRNFADHYGLEPGAELRLAVGNAQYRLTVAGIALSPEFLLAPSSPNYFVPLKGAVGVIFAPQRLVANRLNFSLVNSVLVKYVEGADKNNVMERVRNELSKRLQIDAVTPLAQQFSNLFLKVDLDAFAIFVPAIIIVFVLATIIVGLFLIARWVAAQRSTLGIYMALGYRKGQLVLAQCYPMLAIAVLAMIIAIPVAYLTLYDFGLIYADALGLPTPLLELRPVYMWEGFAGILLCMIVMAAWPLARVLRLTPQEAVRDTPTTEPPGDEGATRWLDRLRNQVTFFYPMRSLLRSHLITSLTVVSIGLAIGVSLSYLIAGDSYLYTIDRGFARDDWNLSVGFMVPVWSDELPPYREAGETKRSEGILRGSFRLTRVGKEEPALLTGIAPGKSLRQPNIIQGRDLQIGDDNALVMEYNLAQRMGVTPGGLLTVRHDNDHFSARVVGIFSGTTPGAVYAPLNSVQRWLEMEGQVTGLLMKTKGDTQVIAEKLRGMKRVADVTVKSELTTKVLELTSQILSLIYVTTAFSVAVTLIILIASTSFTVMERRQEYGVLRVLGFTASTVRSMLLIEVVLLALAGIALSLPIGYLITRFLNARLSEAWFLIMTDLSWQSFAVAWLPALAALPVAAIPSVRNVLTTPLLNLVRHRRLG
jgi:ABC-type antimicrobial peptide transport system permease subunit